MLVSFWLFSLSKWNNDFHTFRGSTAQQPKQVQNNPPPKISPSQAKTQTVVNIQAPKPTVSVAPVQPQTTQSSISQSISNVTSAILQRAPSVTSRSSDPPKGNPPPPQAPPPQIPPRVQSQSSVTSRGPPPAIPPRNNVPAPTRSSSIQVTSVTALNRPALARQQSANSIQPQCTPQPAPKFVIPQRQNSRTSLNRSGSISGPSSNGE